MLVEELRERRLHLRALDKTKFAGVRRAAREDLVDEALRRPRATAREGTLEAPHAKRDVEFIFR